MICFRHRFIFAVTFFVVAFHNFILVNAADKFPAEEVQIIYIPGWQGLQTKGSSRERELSILKEIFPNAKIGVRDWESQGKFDECKKRADQFVANEIAEEIEKYPVKAREKLILIGHSLGGRITIRVMALLARKNKPILRGIFLAAAIPNDDPDIALAIKNTSQPNINVYNRRDPALRQAYAYADKLQNALGAYGYAFAVYQSDLFQLKNSAKGIEYKNHEAIAYLSFLLKRKDVFKKTKRQLNILDHSTERKLIDSIKVDHAHEPTPIDGSIRAGWKIVETFAEWRLERKKKLFKESYRIIDPYDRQRAIGDEQKMKESFECIKLQLEKLNKEF